MPSRTPPTSPTTLDGSPPDLTKEQLRLPTVEIYSDPNPPTKEECSKEGTWTERGSKYAKARSQLDYEYHGVCTREREQLQDAIVTSVIHRLHHPLYTSKVRPQTPSSSSSNPSSSPSWPLNGNGSSTPTKSKKLPVALFTAGGMGAGKGHVLRSFLEQGIIELDETFVWIDPDKLALHLPEWNLYLENPETSTKASTLLHPEASLLQELLTIVARERNFSVVVDGSLSCAGYFEGVMKVFSEKGYTVEILFVFAKEETMRCRAKKREKKTGRRVTPEKIHESRLRSPKSVKKLTQVPYLHRLRLVDNSSDSPDHPPYVVYDSETDAKWWGKEQVPVEEFALKDGTEEEATDDSKADGDEKNSEQGGDEVKGEVGEEERSEDEGKESGENGTRKVKRPVTQEGECDLSDIYGRKGEEKENVEELEKQMGRL